MKSEVAFEKPEISPEAKQTMELKTLYGSGYRIISSQQSRTLEATRYVSTEIYRESRGNSI